MQQSAAASTIVQNYSSTKHRDNSRIEMEGNCDNMETVEIPGMRLNMEDMENLRKVLPELEKDQKDQSQLEIILRAIKYIKDLGDDLKKNY